jgi:hypothetical protein
MNTGYIAMGLGVIGIVVGTLFYAEGWHHTIGLGGIAVGVLLILLGVWISRGGMKAAPAPSTNPPGT